MKKTALTLVIALAGLLILAGCGEKATTTTHADSPAASANTGQAAAAPAANDGMWHGTIAETMDSGGYTYVLLDEGGKQKWIAGPVTKVAVGDKVTIPQGMMMANFPSKTLDRTFEEIWFVGAIYTEGSVPGGMPAMGQMLGLIFVVGTGLFFFAARQQPATEA